MIRRPPRSTLDRSSAASDVYKRQLYEWPEGRKYLGFYVNDQKEGYGKYLWSSGKQFQGWWHGNKQYGLGKYIESEDKVKYGLWENGKRIKWFTDELPAIKEGTLDYTTFFELEKSEEVPKNEQFEQPASFLQAQMAFVKSFPDAGVEEFW
eukprot:TRINITY_DN4026_c0_g1_i4.p1 TRINITY_DN4026_c0_g1~~TRINITY_DN4026_c0_g1_i4.p1  ORF type:complete len:158 (-),score=54.20 TRINITY_DN4026_c0_g1_i4:69-521(-)